MTITALTDGATISWDGTPGSAFTLTIAGNRTVANPTNLIPGQLYTLAITQGPQGSHTLTWSSAYAMAYGVAPALSMNGNDVDVLTLVATSASTMSLVAKTSSVQDTTRPAAPSGLTASSDQAGQVTLGWTNNATDATAVDVELLDLGTWSLLAPLAASATSYVDIYGGAGTGTYRIVAVRQDVVSAPSNEATGTAL